jgi:hypothetical protein
VVVACREPYPGPDLVDLAGTSLSFLVHASQPYGTLHNRLSYDRRWTDTAQAGDWWDRALIAFGTALVRAPRHWMRRASRPTSCADSARPMSWTTGCPVDEEASATGGSARTLSVLSSLPSRARDPRPAAAFDGFDLRDVDEPVRQAHPEPLGLLTQCPESTALRSRRSPRALLP